MNINTQILETLRASVASNDLQTIQLILGKIPLENMEINTTDNLLLFLLNSAFSGNASAAVNLLLNTWDQLEAEDEKSLSIFPRLFTLNKLKDNILQFVVLSMKSQCYEFVISEFIEFDNNTQLLPSYARVDEMYGKQSNETYKKLYQYALDKDNNVMAAYLKKKYFETNPYAQIPEWVYDFEGNYDFEPIEYKYEYNATKLPKARDVLSQIPKISFEPFKLPSIEESIDILTSGFQDLSVQELDNIKNDLFSKYKNMSEEQKMEILQPVLESQEIYNLKGNIELFRILGPVNPHYNTDLTLDHICYKYGGCRMLTCVCFEHDEDEPLDDWFTGICQKCGSKLRSRAHAIRKPLKFGGFVGCFCSTECIKDTVILPDMITYLMIDRIEAQLKKYKVQDRNENVQPESSDYRDTGAEITTVEETY